MEPGGVEGGDFWKDEDVEGKGGEGRGGRLVKGSMVRKGGEGRGGRFVKGRMVRKGGKGRGGRFVKGSMVRKGLGIE